MSMFKTSKTISLIKAKTASFFVVFFLTAISIYGCASQIPKDYPRTETTAITDYATTSTGRIFEKFSAQNNSSSGFLLLKKGRNAFTTRVAMADLAERTLDLQYYIWSADKTGRILAERLVRAADRGVRVRILIDDNGLGGSDSAIAALDAHENIEIRIFNPFANREFTLLNFITDFNRVNHRSHNKMMVVDNAITIVGGRNIGNHYFDVDTEANFRDLDVMGVGPVVRDVSSVFDLFWNGEWAIPITALVDRRYSKTDMETQVNFLRAQIASDDYPYPLDQDLESQRQHFSELENELIWANGEIIYDDPAMVGVKNDNTNIISKLYKKLSQAKEEVLIESAYFVPGDRGVSTATELVERGVKLRILTNSLASNDVVAAHSGHAKFRKQLVENGVDLYELRPDPGSEKQPSIVTLGESEASLHTKALVFDRESVFIGSFNLDPRSANINTEAGLYVESPELAKQVAEYMDIGVLPENSYKIMLEEDGQLYWLTKENGQQVRYDTEPKTTTWQRFMSGLIQLLPIESQL